MPKLCKVRARRGQECLFRDGHDLACSFECNLPPRKRQQLDAASMVEDVIVSEHASLMNTFMCGICGEEGHNRRTCSRVFCTPFDSSNASVTLLHKEGNQFQLGSSAVRKFMEFQRGVKVLTNTAVLKGNWLNAQGKQYDFH